MATPPPPNPVDPQQGVPPVEPVAPVPPAEPAKKGGKGAKVLRVVVGIVVLVVVKLAFSYFTGPVHAEAGECIQVTGSENDPKVSTKDCTDKDANYKVVKVIDDTFDVNACGTASEAALAQQLGSDKFVLCMNPVNMTTPPK
ncbi:LppU/SCO3897 family protein [Streptomyces sp. NPDC054956]